MAYGGELYGNDAPSPYQVFRDQEALNMQNKRIEEQAMKEQRRNDARVSNFINSAFDKSHFTTGTTASPVINARLKGLIDKYRDIYVKSGKSLDLSDMALGMQSDLMELKAYSDNVKVIKANVMKEADAIAKQYPGFNAQQIYQKAMDRALLKDGKPIQNIEDFDLSRHYASEVIDEDYSGLNIGQKGMFDNLQKLPTTDQDMQIVTRDKSGHEFMVKGKARFNPRFQELSFNQETGEPDIKLRTIPVTTPDGQPYVDKLTGQPVQTVDEEAYGEITQNRQLNARINQLADQRLSDIQKRGAPVDDADREIIKRQVATEQLDGVFRNKKSFTTSKKYALPKGHRYKIGSASEMLPFNLEAAETDRYGNRDLTGQVGNFTIKDPGSRYGSTPAEVWITPNGGLLIRSYNLDERGNRIGAKPDKVYTGQKAKNFIESNSGWSGNNKKDLFKLLDLFDGTGEAPPLPDVPTSDIFPDPYKEVKSRNVKPAPVKSGGGKTPAEKVPKKAKYD